MMKKLCTSLIVLFGLMALHAQVANRTEIDCNNQSQSIYGVLSTGKALLVASEGLDCSICQSKAPALQSWAANNASQVAVWGAMTFTYNSNTPSCTQVNNWVNTYGWSSIFTFVDQGEFYFQSGTPLYWVYSPRDSSRQGPFSNENTAYQAALAAVAPNVSKHEADLRSINYSANASTLFLNDLPGTPGKVALISLGGQLLKQKSFSQNNAQLAIADVPAGIYLLKLSTAGQQKHFKFWKP
jgi:hypothetical protein